MLVVAIKLAVIIALVYGVYRALHKREPRSQPKPDERLHGVDVDGHGWWKQRR
jgi:hypothetical protein